MNQVSDLEQLKEIWLEKVSPFERDLITDISLKMMALYIRDYPIEGESLKVSYQIYKTFLSKSNRECVIL